MKTEKKFKTLDELIPKLPDIIRTACVLAVYAGEDWGKRQLAYGFGADSYEYIDKYIQGGIDLCDKFGETDFYDDYMQYFREYIRPQD